MFILPTFLSITLRAGTGHVSFGSLRLGGIINRVILHSRDVGLDGLGVRSGVKGKGLAVICQTGGKRRTATNLSLSVRSIGIRGLVTLFPSVSALIPVLHSFRNILSYRIATAYGVSSAVSLVVPSVGSSYCLRKSGVMLLSKRAFARVSGALVFGGGGQGVVSDVSMSLTVGSGGVRIFPFLIRVSHCGITINKARGLSVAFGCRLSMLGSPIPFGLKVSVANGLSSFGCGVAGYGCGSVFGPTGRTRLSDAHGGVQGSVHSTMHGRVRRTTPRLKGSLTLMGTTSM